METNFLVVTHALTQWNVEGRIQGHTDLPLNKDGRKMAGQLAKRLLKEHIDSIYTSDLQRTIETALPFARMRSLKIIKDIRLREGRSINQERSDSYPTLPFHTEVENEVGAFERIFFALSEIAHENQGKNVLIISHGGVVELFINHVIASEKSPIRYQGIRMALNRLSFRDGKWHCMSLDEDDFIRKR